MVILAWNQVVLRYRFLSIQTKQMVHKYPA